MARSSKYKRRPLIPFGDIMLPIVGLVGLGLLVFGVKVFFIPQPLNPDTQYHKIMTEQKIDSANVHHEVISDSEGDSSFIAVPVVTTDERDDVHKTVSHNNTAAKVKKRPLPPVKKTLPVIKNFKWYVQVGAFKQVSASSSMKSDIIAKGFKPVVKKSEINGTIFYKVLVPGGATRDQALKIGAKLANLGYPYFLFKR